MRSIAESSFRFESAGDRKSGSPSGEESPLSWFSVAESHADRASSTGFVLSMMFLALTALYAFSLSDAAKPVFTEALAIADEAAFDAGFRLEDFTLSGSKNTPQAVLLDALKLPYKGSSLFYDTAEAHDRLMKIGWIESAEVRRILPSRLEAVITERAPFARWEDAAHKVYVIDREGRILGPEEGQFKTLPLFSGQGAPSAALDFEEALQEREALKDRIQVAELVAERFWSIKLASGPALKLPRKVTPLTLERLDSLLANPKIAGLSLETIDLRLANRTILQLQEPTLANRDKAIAHLTSVEPQTLPAPRRGKAS